MAWSWTAPNGLTGQSTYTAMTTSNGLSTIKFPQLQKYSIVDTTSMNFGAGTGTMDSGQPEASECVLYFCVNTYHAVISNGTLTEEIVSSFPNASTSTNIANAAMYQPPADFTFNPQLVRNGTFVTDKHPKGAVYASNSAVNSTIKPPNDSQAYKIDGATSILVREWVQKTLDGSVSRLTDPKTPIRDVAQVLFAEGLAPAYRRIATSLTAEIRNLASEHVVGTTQVAEVYVEVRWEWLILPAAVLALTLVFMSVTMVMCMLKDVPVWKSSPLPALIYSLDKEYSSMIAVQAPVLSKLEEGAKQFSMAMNKDEEMWQLEGSERTTIVGDAESNDLPEGLHHCRH